MTFLYSQSDAILMERFAAMNRHRGTIGEETTMCVDHCCRLDFDTLLADPLTRAMMDSDGVSESELIAVLELARNARFDEGVAGGVAGG